MILSENSSQPLEKLDGGRQRERCRRNSDAPGVLAADRIHDLVERDAQRATIQEAHAESLFAKIGPDVADAQGRQVAARVAHRILPIPLRHRGRRKDEQDVRHPVFGTKSPLDVFIKRRKGFSDPIPRCKCLIRFLKCFHKLKS